jgi:TPR repeat protein
MKNKIRFIAVILSIFALTSCASNNQAAQQYARGKEQFMQQNYRQAFTTLMPVAKKGNPDAQYAVGYMYFYGKGVVENKPAAKYWMQKAADQGNQPAKRALATIE